jgi:prepilin-type N-terminal cleavage/methylation domain-containing protein
MRRTKAFTLVELLVVVGIIGMLAGMLIPSIQTAMRIAEAAACMANLRSIGTAVGIYQQQNDQSWPWIPNVTSDWSKVPTGTNRDADPGQDPKKPGDRSITALLFLLVRDRQSPRLFLCPGDDGAEEDTPTRWDDDNDAATASVYYWDFAESRNVSYSVQAPVRKGEKYLNGMSDEEGAAVTVGDKTRAASDSDWQPGALTEQTSREEVRRNLSDNHRSIGVINVLRADFSVFQAKRPDIGIDRDNIYTASGQKEAGDREATSLDISQHLSVHDTFLIGPIGDSAAAGAAQD